MLQIETSFLSNNCDFYTTGKSIRRLCLKSSCSPCWNNEHNCTFWYSNIYVLHRTSTLRQKERCL